MTRPSTILSGSKFFYHNWLTFLLAQWLSFLLTKAALNDISCNLGDFAYMMQNKNTQLLMERLILVAFLQFSDKIKQEKEYCDAFESILTNLISIGNEKAAVILDEFRVH